jgi:hypothetical protein
MNGEKGQALPLAIMALAIGALVIAPFLGNAGSSLIGSRIYGQTITEQSAGDAGVEHAIWSLTRGTLAEQFTQPGDQVTYQLPETINGITVSVTVTANATSQNGTLGDISAVIDTLQFDSGASAFPSMVMVSANICAVAYSGSSGTKGYLKTMSVAANGDIGNTVIKSLTFDGSKCFTPCIRHVSGDIYAIAYTGTSNRGYLVTVSISTAGVIGTSVIRSLTFDSTSCYEPYIVYVSGTTYAIVYRGGSGPTANYGYIKTVSIPASGTPLAVIATRNFVSSVCYEPEMTLVSGSIFAIAYRGTINNYGYLSTISIAANGTIGAATISTLTFDSSACYTPSLIQVAGSAYAIAYRGPSNYGYIKTVSIPANGVNPAVIAARTFISFACYEPDIVYAASDVYAISYRGTSNYGYLKTISIAASGTIGASIIDSLTFDTSACYEPVIVNVTGGIFAIAYRGSGNAGYLKTVGITTQTAVAASWEIVSTAGDSTIDAFVNTSNTTSTIIAWRIQ